MAARTTLGAGPVLRGSDCVSFRPSLPSTPDRSTPRTCACWNGAYSSLRGRGRVPSPTPVYPHVPGWKTRFSPRTRGVFESRPSRPTHTKQKTTGPAADADQSRVTLVILRLISLIPDSCPGASLRGDPSDTSNSPGPTLQTRGRFPPTDFCPTPTVSPSYTSAPDRTSRRLTGRTLPLAPGSGEDTGVPRAQVLRE